VPAARTFVLTATLLGAALWISRARLGVVGSGDGVRVAFLPSLPELAGLIVLCGLVLTTAAAFAERGRGRWPALRTLRVPLLLPLGVLAVLALPYLPVLPDRVPVLTALAGPLRWWIWAAGLAVTAWTAGTALASSRPADTVRRIRPGPAAAAVFAVTALLAAGSAFRLAPGPIYPGGDEPHYLVITQSVLRDGDVRIENNHARRDYREYYAGTLAPHHIVPAREDGAIYSIHPIGAPLAVAPGFAVAGYRGASMTVVLAAALAGLLLWRWARRVTGSDGAATFGWAAVATSAPFLLHSFAIYPETFGALAVMAVLAPAVPEGPALRGALWRGLVVGLLPWLSTKFSPMSLVLLVLVAWRFRHTRDRLAVVVPYACAILGWFAWFYVHWGSPSPTAPYASATQMAAWHLFAGVPGLLFDQEYGVAAVAPLLALTPLGWLALWRQGPSGRRLVLETALPGVALALTIGAYGMWWGGSAPPGRGLVSVLPLAGVPLAALWTATHARVARRAALVLLLAIGAAATATFVLTHEGLLIANGRDGSAALLEYLGPSLDLVRALPSFIAHREDAWRPLLVVAVWTGLGALAWRAAGRVRASGPERAGLAGASLALGALIAGAAAVPVLGIGTPPPRAPAELRASAPAIDSYDAAARPMAIVYDPFRPALPETVPPLVRFEATPGARTARQPVPVLLNARFALPAGTYAVTIEPAPGAALTGAIGLQLGRTGRPRDVWPLDAAAGEAWTRTFTLDMDTSFVGFRTGGDLEARVARLELRPLAIVDRGRRLPRPPVLAAARYEHVPVYFHDEHAYVEATGFWARGRASHELTLGIPGDANPPGVTLRLHSGDGDTRVRLSTPAWSEEIALSRGKAEAVLVPALATQRLLPLTITPETGFVPAERREGVTDRRLLGCWVEVVR
jgi:hypothetical protein